METLKAFSESCSEAYLHEFHRSGDTDAQTGSQVSATRKGFREILEVCGYAVIGKDRDPSQVSHSDPFSN